MAMGGGGFTMDDPLLDRYVLGLVDSPKPKVCFVPTASGDAAAYIDQFTTAFTAYGAEPSVLRLFERDVDDIVEFLGSQDAVYVGGGNTVNMLAIWKLHGVDDALRNAWEKGVVLAGLSAGACCWFEAFTTNSYGSDSVAAGDGLGFLEGSFSPHHSSEPTRRPALARMIGDGTLPPGFACDDFAAIHFEDTGHQAITSRRDAAAYRVAPGEVDTWKEVQLTSSYLG